MSRRALALLLCVAPALAQRPTVSHSAGVWTVHGRKNSVELNERDLAVTVRAGGVAWKMVPSSERDMLISAGGDRFWLGLAAAGRIHVEPYETGFKTGVRLILDQFRGAGQIAPGAPVDARVVLTLCLEQPDEDLVAEAMVNEGAAAVKELHWPFAMDGREVDYTVLSSDNGTLLPRDWPKPYHPIQRAAGDRSIVHSHLIESWSMSWWGFEKGTAAMILIVETPDDAAYTFDHPAGGPTSIGPIWRAQLGRFGYLRSVRMEFLDKGNYVDLAKRYRRYVVDSGLFVSLKEKIARQPLVRNLIGSPFMGASVLRNKRPGAATYDTKNPESNRRLTTFDQNIQRLREMKAQGWQHLNVSLSGWLSHGYDRRTPDALPPPAEAGGWAGMKAFFDACKEAGYTCWLHDQYRDYYTDAPSWNPDFAVHAEDNLAPPDAFPGTRFKNDWKDGYIPMMDHWDGGVQGYLNNRFMLGHVIKNYREMFEHGIRPQGTYQDVFGYIPPDEDFNPNHPGTRTDSMNSRAAVLRWSRNNLGIVGTEAGSDWLVPFVDYTTSRFNRGANTGTDPDHQDAIPVPLYELVYHDAVVTAATPGNLRSLLHGNAPQIGYGRVDADAEQIRRMAALHARVGLLEMTNHEFLDAARHKERTTFADGTTVTVDWTRNTVEIRPDVALNAAQPKIPVNYDESKVGNYTLPDPLVLRDGTPVRDAAAWTNRRRPELVRLFEENVYGRSPGRPAAETFEVFDLDRRALGGKAVRKQVTVYFSSRRDGPREDILIYLPAGAKGPVPVILSLNFSGNQTVIDDPGVRLPVVWDRTNKTTHPAAGDTRGNAKDFAGAVEKALARGYGFATIYYCDIEPDFIGGMPFGVRPLFFQPGRTEPAPGDWGALAAWGWGLSRAIDYMETDREIDVKRVAVLGQSRLGKTVLWAGARDTRIAMVLANCSGEGGAALARRWYGETVKHMNVNFPYQFCANYRKYGDDPNTMPVDTHELIALIAPRPVYLGTAVDDQWSDPKGEFLAAVAAGPVYRLLGKRGLETSQMPPLDQPILHDIGYHCRSGKHEITAFDWEQFLRFADMHLGARQP